MIVVAHPGFVPTLAAGEVLGCLHLAALDENNDIFDLSTGEVRVAMVEVSRCIGGAAEQTTSCLRQGAHDHEASATRTGKTTSAIPMSIDSDTVSGIVCEWRGRRSYSVPCGPIRRQTGLRRMYGRWLEHMA